VLSGRRPYFLLGVVVLLSRIPFLGRGFGVEEDAWGTAVAVRNTLSTGVFETSRLPGHPVNEFFYLLLWPADSWWFNLSSALCSVVFSVVFLRILVLSGISRERAFFGSLACCLIPVIYVSSTCTMDYIWGLMFVSLSWLMVLKKRTVAAGLFVGLAIGSRITMAGMFIPFLLLIQGDKQTRIREYVCFSLSALVMSILVFIPVIWVYGIDFFTYSDQFPYPNWPKVIYKFSIGVWGVPGILAIVLWILSLKGKVITELKTLDGIFTFSVLFIYTGVYFILPQKSAYMIAIVPPLIFFFIRLLGDKSFYVGILFLAISSFILGFNLSDPYRGSENNYEICHFNAGGQEVFLDGLGGAILHDFSKRKLKNEYCSAVVNSSGADSLPKSVICGWWYNQVLIYSDYLGKPANTEWLFYADYDTLKVRLKKGVKLYYLSEQNTYNHLMFPKTKDVFMSPMDIY